MAHKKRVLEKLKLTEISGVDRPCQEGARVAIMKRDNSQEILSDRVARLHKQISDLQKDWSPQAREAALEARRQHKRPEQPKQIQTRRQMLSVLRGKKRPLRSKAYYERLNNGTGPATDVEMEDAWRAGWRPKKNKKDKNKVAPGRTISVAAHGLHDLKAEGKSFSGAPALGLAYLYATRNVSKFREVAKQMTAIELANLADQVRKNAIDDGERLSLRIIGDELRKRLENGELNKFDVNQARDALGRWTAAGISGVKAVARHPVTRFLGRTAGSAAVVAGTIAAMGAVGNVIGPKYTPEQRAAALANFNRTRQLSGVLHNNQLHWQTQNPIRSALASIDRPKPQPGTTASVAFMITRDVKQQLLDRGYKLSEIHNMTPEKARSLLKFAIVSNNIRKQLSSLAGGLPATHQPTEV